MVTLVKLLVVAALAAASASHAFAAAPARSDPANAATRTASEAQSRQQNRMASCNRDAVGKKGDERRAFMKQCLSSSSAQSAKTESTDSGARPSRRKASQ